MIPAINILEIGVSYGLFRLYVTEVGEA